MMISAMFCSCVCLKQVTQFTSKMLSFGLATSLQIIKQVLVKKSIACEINRVSWSDSLGIKNDVCKVVKRGREISKY